MITRKAKILFDIQVAWHPHDDIVASCSYDNKIKMYKEDDDDWVRPAHLTYESLGNIPVYQVKSVDGESKNIAKVYMEIFNSETMFQSFLLLKKLRLLVILRFDI